MYTLKEKYYNKQEGNPERPRSVKDKEVQAQMIARRLKRRQAHLIDKKGYMTQNDRLRGRKGRWEERRTS